MTKLTINEIERDTNKVVKTWEHECDDIAHAYKVIKKIDACVVKNHFRFQYVIEEMGK